MAGIVFFQTEKYEEVSRFYTEELEMSIWLKQQDCLILQHGNLLLGFCEREPTQKNGIITLFYPHREQIDTQYKQLKDRAQAPPVVNEQYNIYHFFASDPEGRLIEFQAFLHRLPPSMTAEELFLARRSIRKFSPEKIPQDVLWQIFEICRYSPTSMDKQAYYYVVVQDSAKQDALSELRAPAAPIANAPAAVAVCTDPDESGRPEQDTCIAAYHFMLAARIFGLGTCWIAAMDRPEAKDILGIPHNHTIATIMPLGYPGERPGEKGRRPADEFVVFVGEE